MEASVSPAELKEAEQLLADLVRVYSPSGGEGKIADLVEEILRADGMTVRRVPAEVGRESLVVGASRDPVLVIAAHLDTIVPTWDGATEPRVEDGFLHGLGSVDDKGGVATLILAARRMAAAGADLDSLPVVFAFPVDEEMGGSGSRSLAIDLAPRFAIAMEGTGLKTGLAECGDLEANIHVRGVSSHGSLVDLGENAAHSAAGLITALDELGANRHTHPLLGQSRVTVTEVATGDGMNVIPDSCTLRLRWQLMPDQDLFEALKEVEDFAARFNADVQMIEGTSSYELPTDSPLLAVVEEATERVTGQRPDAIGIPSWTDAHNFVDFGGSEAMVFGPGALGTAHTPAENIELAEIVHCAKIFEAMLTPENLARMAGAPPRTDPPRYRKGPA